MKEEAHARHVLFIPPTFNVPLSNQMGRNMVEHHMAVLRPLIGKEVMLETDDGITTIRTLDGWELHIYNAARLHCAGIAEPLEQPHGNCF